MTAPFRPGAPVEGLGHLHGQQFDPAPQWAQELRESQRRIEAQLVLLMGRLAVNPVDMAGALGEALAKAQGYDRPIAMTDTDGNDLIQTPRLVVYEPENEAWDRQQPDWEDEAANQSWWDTMTNGERPPGELDSEGP